MDWLMTSTWGDVRAGMTVALGLSALLFLLIFFVVSFVSWFDDRSEPTNSELTYVGYLWIGFVKFRDALHHLW